MEDDDSYTTSSAYSDAEVDSEVEDVDMEQQFGIWLEELNNIQQDGSGGSSAVKKATVTPKHMMESMRSSLVTTSSDGGFCVDDLDDMLGEFNDIVESLNSQQSEITSSLQSASKSVHPPPPIDTGIDDIDSQLMNALLELDSLAGNKPDDKASEEGGDKSYQSFSHNRLSCASSSSEAEYPRAVELGSNRETSPHKLSTRLMAPKTLPKETINPVSDVLSVLSEGLPYPELQELMSPDAQDRGSDRDSAYSDSTSIPSSGSHVSVGMSSHTGSSQPAPPSTGNTEPPTDLEQFVDYVREALAQGNLSPAEKANKEEKLRQALEKIKEAKIRKLFVRAYTPDGSSKSILVDEKMTVKEIRDALVIKNHAQPNVKWSVIEQLPDLLMERVLEDHDFLVESMVMWTRDSTNKIMFDERPAKYDVFIRPELYLLDNQDPMNPMPESDRAALIQEYFSDDVERIPDLEGPLYLKADGKKAWKRFYFTLRASGLYYNPKGKGKSSKDLVCLQKFNLVDVYTGNGWKKKYKAPTEYGIALKHPQIQKKSSKYIRYLCAEDQKSFYRWLTGIRIAKHGQKLYKNYLESRQTVGNWSDSEHSANPNFPDYLAKQNEANQQIARRHSTMRIPNSPSARKLENGSVHSDMSSLCYEPSLSDSQINRSGSSISRSDSPVSRSDSLLNRSESPTARTGSPIQRTDSPKQRESPSHVISSPIHHNVPQGHYESMAQYSQDMTPYSGNSTTMPRRKSVDMLDDFDEPSLQRDYPRRSSVQHLDLTTSYDTSVRRAGTIHRSDNIGGTLQRADNMGGLRASQKKKVPVLPLTANTTKLLGDQSSSTMRRVTKETTSRGTILPGSSQPFQQQPPLASLGQRSHTIHSGSHYAEPPAFSSDHHGMSHSQISRTTLGYAPSLTSMSQSFPTCGRSSPHRLDSSILSQHSSPQRKDSQGSPPKPFRKESTTTPPQPPPLRKESSILSPGKVKDTPPPAPQPQRQMTPPEPPPLRQEKMPLPPPDNVLTPPVSPKPPVIRAESPVLPPPPPEMTDGGPDFPEDDLPLPPLDLPPPPPELLDPDMDSVPDLPPPPSPSSLKSSRRPSYSPPPVPEVSHYASVPVRVSEEQGQLDKRASVASTISTSSSGSSHVYDEPQKLHGSPQRATAQPNVPPGYKQPRPYAGGSPSSAGNSPSHRARPPPPPKRAESTRLTTTSVNYASPNYVIDDLQRMLNDKHNYIGGYASKQATGPIPLPAYKPLPQDCMSSMSFEYLPPPPADLLQGLRNSRKSRPPPTPRRATTMSMRK